MDTSAHGLLDFLGFGLPPTDPSWGRLLNQGFSSDHFAISGFLPVLAMATTLFLVVLIGEAVREAFDLIFSRLVMAMADKNKKTDSQQEPLVSVRDLHTDFTVEGKTAQAVDGVSFDIMPGEGLGLVGESGCGKSVTALSLLKLIPDPPGKIRKGSAIFRGRDLLAMDYDEMRKIRGNEIAMIFQEPMTALNRVFSIGFQMRGRFSTINWPVKKKRITAPSRCWKRSGFPMRKLDSITTRINSPAECVKG